MAITYRSEKGLPLTSAEIDANFAEVEAIGDGQFSNALVYSTYAGLPSTGVPNTSYKVSNDPDTALNGYYHYDGGWIKDADLANGVVESGNSDAVSGDAVYDYSQLKLDLKLDKVPSSNLLNPDTFRYGYFYYQGTEQNIEYNSNNAYGCTDYISASTLGLISINTGVSTQGVSSYVVFDENKTFIRSVSDSNQYTFVAGDIYVVFVHYVNGDTTFAERTSVLEGTVYSFEDYTINKPFTDLENRVEALEDEGASVGTVTNGIASTFGDVSNFLNESLIQERNIVDDYLVFYKEGTGNAWIYTPIFVPTGSNLVHIRFTAEITRVGSHDKGLAVYVADGINTLGLFNSLQDIQTDGEYDIVFDSAYYTVYEGYTQFCVWFANQTMADGESLTVKLSNLRVEEYIDAVTGVNISGDTSKELFESTDNALNGIASIAANKTLTSPTGVKYEIAVTDLGQIVPVPIIPNKTTFFGNSLLLGFGNFGMAASASDKDYYALIEGHIQTLNPSHTSTTFTGYQFEILDNPANIDSTIQSIFIDNLVGDENLVVIQLGDNISTVEQNAVFAESSLKLCQAIRAKCPSARVVWMGLWFGTTEKYKVIQTACLKTACKFIAFSDLISDASVGLIGDLINRGLDTRTLTDVTNVVENTPTNITVTFEVLTFPYSTTLDITSYSLNSTTLTYVGDYEIVSNHGVAVHPNDEGFRLISNKFLYEMDLSNTEEQYI